MKKMIVVFVALIFILCSCSVQNTKTNIRRLSDDYNGDWATDAIGKFEDREFDTLPVKVAVLDTGCNAKNESVIKNINIISHKNATDTVGHGTYIIEKILQINPKIEIYSIKISDDENQISEENLSKGIEKAAEFNVDVINLSVGTKTNYQKLQKAVDLCDQKDIFIVAAVGNYGGDLLYPAKYGNTFCAMGRDINNKDLSFNGKSLDKKSFSAPGDHVLCEDTYITGSSIATAFLTGAVSRILNYKYDISMDEVMEILISACNDATSYSYGMINYNRLEKILETEAKLW